MKNVEKIGKMIYDILHSEEFKEHHRMQEKDFTRKRKMGFAQVSTVILKGVKRGLQAGITEFLDETKSDINEYSKAAFCKARQRISPDAFKELFEVTASEYYTSGEYKTFQGYRVCAIDGSDINLPNTQELFEKYGSEPYGNGIIQVQSLVSCLYDVMNHVILDASMNPYYCDERKAALEHLEKLDKIRTDKELLIMDRGYPSEELMTAIEAKGFKYLIRVNKNNFFREIRDTNDDDVILCRKTKHGELQYRLVLITLKNGTVEALITNLTESAVTKQMLSKLYQMRWGIETKYNDLKNKLQIENFSGITPLCILQDFYSTLFLSNILAYVEADYAEDIEKINSSEKYKLEYKMNTNHAVFVLRKSVVEMLLTDSSKQQRKIFSNIEREFKRCLSPVRKGRYFPRNHRHLSSLFANNRKLN